MYLKQISTIIELLSVSFLYAWQIYNIKFISLFLLRYQEYLLGKTQISSEGFWEAQWLTQH